MIHRLASAHALQRGEDLGLLHHPQRQSGIQRRQRQRAIFEHLDQLTAGAEQDDRPELRIEAAADDQLVAIELRHRLHGHALEVLRADFLGDRAPNALERRLHRIGIAQVQLHAADVGLVGDGQRVQLQNDRIADLLGRLHRLLFGFGDARLNRGNVVRLRAAAWIRTPSGWCGPTCGPR